MSIRTNIGMRLLLTATLCFLGACARTQLEVEPVPRSENPVTQINVLNEDIRKAGENQIDVLAPTWFAKAETSQREAQKLLDRAADSSKVLRKVAEGRAQLRRAEESAQLARASLSASIEARDLARAAGAARLHRDYTEVEEQFLELTRAVEKNKLLWVRRNEAEVTIAFRHLELQAIKREALGEARKLIEEAETVGAGRMAPETFAIAQEKLTEADRFISSHRYEKEKIDTRASEALFQVRRVLQVARQSGDFQAMQPEQITLWYEGFLHRITVELSAPDMRDRTFDTQVESILGSIRTLKAQQAETQAIKKRVASLEQRTREEQVEKERLAAERRFNQLFNEVQTYFRPDEAEVYKQENRLVIRLKGMQFPVGKDFIMPHNYALLSKVQRAIRVFGEPDVIIEGHTDSTGTEKLNERLSWRRAEAVRQYLVANGTLTEDRVVAFGYGSKRPLASNQTEEGRAINRRIDLIIAPRPHQTEG